MSIEKQAIKGVLWNSVERFSTQGIQFVLTIVIARILSPNDYGLVAMLSIFLSIAQTLVDSGFANALIQKNNRTDTDYSTTFHFNLVISLLIYLVLYFTAPLIARFYDQPLLTLITRVLGLTLIINSFSIVQQAHLTVLLDFKKQAFASLLSVIIGGGVGIWMAYHGYGVWTLVWQTLISATFNSIFLWIYAHWTPRWIFSWRSFHELFSFGSKIMLSAMLHTIYTNMYSLVVGKAFNAATLGYFNRAYTLGQFPVQNFSNIVLKVIYPIQCHYQNDNEKFNYIFINYLRLSCFILFPLMISFAALAKPIVIILLTDKWLPAVPLLQIICIAQMWDPVMKINASALDAKGRSDYRLYSEILKKIVAFGILFLSIPLGMKAICGGLVLYAFADMAIIISYSRKVMNRGYRWQAGVLLPLLLASISMGGLIFWIIRYFDSPWQQLVFGFFIGLFFYIGVSYFCKFSEIHYFYLLLKGKKKIDEYNEDHEKGDLV
ncbi:MAG: lipopolysaccharide biosynthesis protein [Bacteroides sp.]|jgi:O-antigen/teichoic acid export membrane protein|nr:lipopolysaccharide biosynthesis protein [Bacteroides sp.]MCI1683066.1 lipopolysaccharide biosynthesis protein [Bacteroides sp.]